MADEVVPSDRSTDVKLHSDLVSVATTQHQPVVEPQQRSLSKISIPPSVGRLIPGHQLGRYELLCPIARGGMASVWVARLQGAHGFEKLVALKTRHPDAEILAHPECEDAVLKMADYVGSTTGILKHALASPKNEFIVATEAGILHQMQKQAPHQTFIAAPQEGKSA